MQNLQLFFPEIFLSLSIMFLLVLGVFKKNSSQLIQNISLIVLLITAVITFNETISINFYMDYIGFFGYEQSTDLFFKEPGSMNYGL